VLGVKEEPQAIYDQFMEDLLPFYRDKFELKSGAKEFIKTLKENGCALNVISGSPHRFVDACLKRHGIYSEFDNVWSVEDFNIAKSDKALYEKLSKHVGIKPYNCVLVDDSIGAIKTAKSTGFYTIGIFETVVENYWGEVKATADKTILDFTELL
jgi:HAD superfamily hydrolase (TIGR01509 family)